MNQQIINKPAQNQLNPACADSMMSAEHELSSFFTAVRKLFGLEQARISAKDWLEELRTASTMPISTHEWRRITINAAIRLAGRMAHSSPLVA